MFFDTHAHYDDEAFSDDRDALLQAVHDAGVDYVIDPGCDAASTRKAAEIAKKHPFVFFASGIHPEELKGMQDEDLAVIRTLAEDEKCVAIGEIGLDYYWDTEHKEEQKRLFRRQLDLALEMDLPVIIHDREAHGDCFEIVREYTGLRGVFHCYSGSPEMAAELLKQGWHLGFDGPITYKNAKKALEVLLMTPPDRILIETDSPYLSPVPMRGKRNDSRNLLYVAEKIAEIKGMKTDEVAGITMENAKRLFQI